MTVVRTFESHTNALIAAERLIEFGFDARVVESGDGRVSVVIDGGSKTVALDILAHGQPRFGRSVGWERSRRAPRLTMIQFGSVAGGAVAAFVLWMGLTNAYGAPVLIVVVATVAVIGAGLWFVTPEAFEIEGTRPITAEVVAVGALLALAQRVLYDLLPLPADPYRTYPLWLWMAAAAIPTGALMVLVGRLVRSRGHVRIRRTMTLFGGAGLAYATIAAATYILDLGFTSGRWGLVPVWAVLGIYPVLTIPFHVFGAGILGWGWASGGCRKTVSLLLVILGLAVLHSSIVRSPFWGPLFVAAYGALWLALFVRNPENDPMVERVPERLLPPEDV